MSRRKDKPIFPSTLSRAERIHISFLMRITGTATGRPGGRLYSDGGPSPVGVAKRRARNRAAAKSRRRNRTTT